MGWNFSENIDLDKKENKEKTFQELPLELQKDFEKSNQEIQKINYQINFEDKKIKSPKTISKKFVSKESEMTLEQYIEEMSKTLQVIKNQD